jgi:3-deoxy-D-manno-octulosonic-acid transferase
MRIFYTLLLYLGTPLLLGRLYWRGFKAPAYRVRWTERFGFFSLSPKPGGTWIHAVSVGEVRAALPLIRALQARQPHRRVLVTTTTPTGSRQVRDELGDSVDHLYLPYDLPGAVRRFLDRAAPRLAVIMETELWPNLFQACRCRGIPLVVANARLSPRSARGYARLAGLTATTLACATRVAAQSEADAVRFRALGAPAERVVVIGNLKYDLALPEDLPEQARRLRQQLGPGRPVLIGASTHAGEDEALLDAAVQLQSSLPDLLLVLAPRHPERFDAVATLCRRRGLATVRRSEHAACSPVVRVFLGDTLGELLLFYAASDVAFVGGSLAPVGGHNVLEPALLGLPLLLGPHTFNFTEASETLLAGEAAWRVDDAGGLARAAARLFGDPRLRRAMGDRGRELVKRHRGALAKLLELVDELPASDTPAPSGYH